MVHFVMIVAQVTDKICRKAPPKGRGTMTESLPDNRSPILLDVQGKGTLGCLISLALIGLVLFIVIRVGPDYYAFKGFETDVKAEASRAGANFLSDEILRKNIMDLARRNEVRILSENVMIERFAGQIFITIKHTIKMDLILYEHDFDMQIKASSYIGRL
jgi:hypothetical protein